MRTSTEDVTKLPKWAQHLIEKLEADCAYWKRAATPDVDDSNTFVRHGLDGKQHLGKNVRVNFQVGPGRLDEIEAVLDSDGTSLLIRGGSSLLVAPSASNSLRVMMRSGF